MSKEYRLAVGKISGAFGIRGWVKVFSFTEPVENILRYSPWMVFTHGQWREMKVITGRVHGKGVVAQLTGIDDRNAAELLNGAAIEVAREQMPEPEEGAFYWEDLEGMSVVNEQGQLLGQVSHLFETAAHQIMVVADGDVERMIPFVDQYIVDVQPDEATVVVDWQADW